MPDVSDTQLLSAIDAFQKARWQGTLEQVLASITGRSADLLSYNQVRDAIGARETAKRELQEIPVASIVGSVGRYQDFTRGFLPRVEEDEQRWSRVWAQVESMTGLPPIEVFKIGEVFFVRDGNHRVSVARQQGFETIEGYVTEVSAPVSFSPDDDLEDLILKARSTRFLEATDLAANYPAIDLTMSVAGNYRVLESQIRLHQHWLEEQGTLLSYPEAAGRWYEEVYWPVVKFIRQRGILRDFPRRTETDLYVWIDKYRRELSDHLGWSVDAETAVLDLADKQTPSPRRAIRQLGQRLREAITPAALEAGPAVGEWRASWLATYREDRLFSHVLVAIDGQDAGWGALQQAIRVARREEGQVFGLHVRESPEEIENAVAAGVRDEFERLCAAGGVSGELTITTGPVTGTICYRARWADLVVVSLSHPPGPQPVSRLSSHFGQLLRRCPRPVLAVPRTHANLDRILLAYDGSPKAEEALHVAAYLAGGWGSSLTVVVALDRRVTEAAGDRIRAALEAHRIEPEYVIEKSPPAPLILSTARERDCGMILMGGYGRTPAMEIVAGSVVDEVLRTRNRPVLICR